MSLTILGLESRTRYRSSELLSCAPINPERQKRVVSDTAA
jgi:hypothetical protein